MNSSKTDGNRGSDPDSIHILVSLMVSPWPSCLGCLNESITTEKPETLDWLEL